MNDEESARQLSIQANFYNPNDVPDAFRQILEGSSLSTDVLDNALYYLLNHYASESIQDRLVTASEVHPNEIARRIARGEFNKTAPIPENVAEDEAEERPARETRRSGSGKSLSKVEQARRLLGG